MKAQSYIIALSLIFTLSLLTTCGNRTKTTEAEKDVNKVDTSISTDCSESMTTLPAKILKFVPANYTTLDTVTGDLNLDGIQDLILVLKKNGEDTLSNMVDHIEKRPLLLLLRNAKNELELARKNDNTIYCIDCGGMMGDPYVGVTIKDGSFSVEHYGGSAWRWGRATTYKYDKEASEWFLDKDESESFHTSEPEKVKHKIKTAKDFGQVKFEEFDIYKEEE